ncbi:uncharacterized protein LOC129762512 isoform X2 [Toxorhynchites rutilus septentrionalis]|uniref:uncharacterized protein LOC129762512 isoform X2 n=1 Tax=Toxorhynchites rutilus septentrionalis TaxID=329112 RepID=UPI002478BB09|nr:uncharacterized protein LOC129762512 isoform X2 [Toxorhynchites rutilus septentrionalis]
MKIKVTALLMVVSTFCVTPGRSGLLRTPKVYNAVITTDENLTPSRAFPVVQPVVHETGFAYPFGAFGPFGLYNALNSYPGYYPPQGATAADSNAARLDGRNTFYAGRDSQPQLQETPIETLPGSKPFSEPNLPLREAPLPEVIPEPNNSIAPKAPEGPQPNYEDRPADAAKGPIQLNEFGFPPSLIPLQSYNSNTQSSQPFNFNGYPYNFPVLYDSFGNYNSGQYPSVLPPFGYFPHLNQPNPYFAPNIPQNGGSGSLGPQQINRNGRLQDIQEAPKGNPQETTVGNTEAAPDSPTTVAAAVEAAGIDSTEQNDQEVAPTVAGLPENIKNNGNTNKDIPDVPPPPIPSGAKKVEQ